MQYSLNLEELSTGYIPQKMKTKQVFNAMLGDYHNPTMILIKGE